ncbi:MAG TPA: efflux RND transporter periplasmic adaptor subunit [Anaeromyxobacter sp.]|nr:efflux RND transporter periplasmic adaptor subunit [Anaeromyxobacter sp.]
MSAQEPASGASPEPGELPPSPTLAPPPPRLRMSWPKRILAALFVVAVAALTVASLRPRPPVPLKIQLVTARRGPITRVVTAAGKLQAATEVKLSANISGDLLELAAHEGDRVRKGQVLGRIDARRYTAQVAQAEAARASAAADVEGEKVKVKQLGQDLARVQRLADGGNASSAELENARAALDGEISRLQAAQERVQQAEAALSESRHNLSLTTLSSPIDGFITKREKQVGERVRGSDLSEDVVLIISTLSSMEAKIEVGEHEVVYVKEGDTAEVEIDAFPDQHFPAQVVEVARNATVKNAGTEGEVTTFFVRLALTQPVSGALPGMSAQATISTDTHADAVVVPIQAVTVRPEKDLTGTGPALTDRNAPPPAPGAGPRKARDPLKRCVFVVEKGLAHVRPVETGLASESEIEIVSGLKDGEQVVEGPYRILSRELSDGKPVTEEKPGQKPDKR